MPHWGRAEFQFAAFIDGVDLARIGGGEHLGDCAGAVGVDLPAA